MQLTPKNRDKNLGRACTTRLLTRWRRAGPATRLSPKMPGPPRTRVVYAYWILCMHVGAACFYVVYTSHMHIPAEQLATALCNTATGQVAEM